MTIITSIKEEKYREHLQGNHSNMLDGFISISFQAINSEKKKKILNRKSLLCTVDFLTKNHSATLCQAINVSVQTSITNIKSPQKLPEQIHDTPINNIEISSHHESSGNLSPPRFEKPEKLKEKSPKVEESDNEKKKKEHPSQDIAHENVVILQNITLQGVGSKEERTESSDCKKKKTPGKKRKTVTQNNATDNVSDNLINLSPSTNLAPERVPGKRSRILPCTKLDFKNCTQQSVNSEIDEYIEVSSTLEPMNMENEVAEAQHESLDSTNKENIRNKTEIDHGCDVGNDDIEDANKEKEVVKKKPAKSLDRVIRRLTVDLSTNNVLISTEKKNKHKSETDSKNCSQEYETAQFNSTAIDDYNKVSIFTNETVIEGNKVSEKAPNKTKKRITRKTNENMTGNTADSNVYNSSDPSPIYFIKPTTIPKKYKRSSRIKKNSEESTQEHEYDHSIIDDSNKDTNEAVREENEVSGKTPNKTKKRFTRRTNENMAGNTADSNVNNSSDPSPISSIKPTKNPNKHKKSYTRKISHQHETEQCDHTVIDDHNEVSIVMNEALRTDDKVEEKDPTTSLDRSKNILTGKSSETVSKDKAESNASDSVNSSPNIFLKPIRPPKKTKRVPRTKLDSKTTKEIDSSNNGGTSSDDTSKKKSDEMNDTDNVIRRSTREKKKLDPQWWAAIIGEPTTKKVKNDSTTKQSVKKGSKLSGKKKKASNVPESTTATTDSLIDVTSSIKNSTNPTINNTECTTNHTELTENDTNFPVPNIEFTTPNTELTTPDTDLTKNVGFPMNTANSDKKSTSKKKNKKRTNLYGNCYKKNTNKKNSSAKSPQKKKVKNPPESCAGDVASCDGDIATCDGDVATSDVADKSGIHLQEWRKNEMEINQLGNLCPGIYNIRKNCGYLALPPKHNKEFMNKEYTMTFSRHEGINSIKLGEEYLQEAPCCFHIPKGCPAVVTNTGDNRLLLFFVLEK